jgi:MoaA/NifB/PqqE/SkfB family radical SAM enzyme
MIDFEQQKQLKTMIGRKDYQRFAGPDWPSYEEIINGDLGSNPAIAIEVKDFVRMMAENYQTQVLQGDQLALANQRRQRQIFFDKKYTGSHCRVPWNTMGINANGDVFICHSPSWIPKFVGNLQQTTSIYDLLNNDLCLSIRQEILEGRYTYCNNHICGFFSPIPTDEYQSQGPEIQPARLYRRPELYIDRIPSHIILDFDATCNFRCPSCRTELINNNKNHVMRAVNNRLVGLIKHMIIDQITEHPVCIRWCGGEPFISDVYLDLLQYIASSDKKSMISHHIQTNGSYLKKKSDLVLSLLPTISQMRVSFDAATADTYHKVRVGGKWNQLLENVRWLRQQIDQYAPRCQLFADYVVQLDNYQEIPMFVTLCKELDIKHINWQKMWNWGTWSQEEFDRKNIYNPTHPLYADLVKQFKEINYSMSLI